jgi:hypothetical protein
MAGNAGREGGARPLQEALGERGRRRRAFQAVGQLLWIRLVAAHLGAATLAPDSSPAACTLRGSPTRWRRRRCAAPARAWPSTAHSLLLLVHPRFVLPHSRLWSPTTYQPARWVLFDNTFHPFGFEIPRGMCALVKTESDLCRLAASRRASRARLKARYMLTRGGGEGGWCFGNPRDDPPPPRAEQRFPFLQFQKSFLVSRTLPETNKRKT